MGEYLDVQALGQVLLASLVAGAGLVCVFALGLVGWSAFETRPAGPGAGSGQLVRYGGLLLAVACFAVVVTGVVLGVGTILSK